MILADKDYFGDVTVFENLPSFFAMISPKLEYGISLTHESFVWVKGL